MKGAILAGGTGSRRFPLTKGTYKHLLPVYNAPMIIARAMKGQTILVYGDGLQIRDWVFVVDHCAAIDSVLHHGRDGEIYNLGAGNEWTNREIAGRILQLLGKPESLLAHVQDRPGHDRRYALDRAKAQKQLGWVPRTMLEDGLKQTVAWYLANREWMRRVSARKFKSYCRQQYDERETMLAGIRDTNGRA